MAKATTIKVKLVSSADTGFYYVTRKNSRTMPLLPILRILGARRRPPPLIDFDQFVPLASLP